MAFEFEILRIKPFQESIPLANDEVAPVLRAMQMAIDSSAEPFNLQSLLLRLRLEGKPVRMAALVEALEFLDEHELIENPNLHGWLALIHQGLPSRTPLFGRLRRLWHRKPAPQAEDAPETWENLPVIRQLDPSVRREFLRGARVRHFPKGFRLCREGSHDRQLMILLTGQAGVIKRSAGSAKREVVAILEKQAMFGETSHFFNAPRTADVVAIEDCRVLCIPAKDDTAQLQRAQFQRLQTRVWFLQALQRNPLFQEIPGEAFDALLLNGEVKNFTAGQTLVREGEMAVDCFFVIQGEVRIERKGAEINRLTSGSVIGEVALLQGRGGRTATAIAMNNVMTIRYDRDQFWTVLSQHFVLGVALERLADKRLARDQARNGTVNSF